MADQAKPRPEQRLGSNEAPTFYANNVNVLVTPWDLRLLFSQILQGDASGIVYKDVVSVYLSPGQARALKRVFDNQMAKYEALWAKQGEMIKSLDEEENSR